MMQSRRCDFGRLLVGMAGCVAVLFFALATVPSRSASAAEMPHPVEDPSRTLALTLRSLDCTQRLLYVTAHPDDEDGGLLAKLAYGDGVETALLTLTRGEGGQNEIGPELFDALGVLRARELQAAGRYLGVTQVFSRAFEFGYSFSVEETFELWHRESVLRDIVAVIREFRPDVILTMLPDGDGGGQHHQASAQLAAEAFGIAATPQWPELGPPHQTRRLFSQVWSDRPLVDGCVVDLGAFDPVLGATYEAIGLASQAQHKCQGMARLSEAFPRRMSRWEWRLGSTETPRAVASFFEGLPTPSFRSSRLEEASHSWTVHGGAGAGGLCDALGRELHVHADPGDGDGASISADAVRLHTYLERVRRAYWLGSGVHTSVRALERFAGPGDPVPLVVDVQNNAANAVKVRWVIDDRTAALGYGALSDVASDVWAIPAGGSVRDTLVVRAPSRPTIPRPVPRTLEAIIGADAAYLDPQWSALSLRFEQAIPVEEGDPEARWVPVVVEASCQELDEAFPSVFYSDPHVVPDPSVRVAEPRLPVPRVRASSGDAPYRAVLDVLVSSLHGGPVAVRMRAPEPWVTEPPEQIVETRPGGPEQTVRFVVRAETPPTSLHPFEAVVEARPAGRIDAPWSATGYQRVQYPHIRPAALLQEARVTCVPFECRVEAGLRIGYVEGVGDGTAEAFAALGLPVEFLDREMLLGGDLSLYDVIMTGVRAYKVRDDLAAAHDRLMAWVERGGVLLVQYNKYEFNAGETESSPFAPFAHTLVGNRRVTVENSPVIVEHPDHPILGTPNQIGKADWADWVQERGLYFLDFEDDRYLDLLTLEDPWPFNAGPKGGALVAASYGRGHWVYIGVGLFRQLPAAVPGAYRLLANLAALGQRADAASP